ncbi:Rne/Rng family ribonuclease [Geothermobacter hydrogeniphilus]|uniref:Ribonuclease G n=1 Tax=Geothermobacter hydrogeniphilus TaxID=1969733 RepID=A0A1X0XXC6_9BACT|nr:Rne/Rng family ribonuclease [Geothermobacter hydrogeniphilus]ORJ57571.1 hypothetical protein B5V00_13220 [Geothermobacter hydrogeniphilus]
MIKKMLVNASNPEENRVAIVEDGVLSELDIEITGREQTKGNIYKAAVVRVETGLQAAFVDYGAERLGFLQLGEIHPSLYPQRDEQESKSRPRINEILHRGQEILVQITKEERGNKGAALTTFLSLPGRYMVLMPDDDARGISRKIPDGAERKALRAAISDLELPTNMGYIIRTAAIGKSADELKRDLDYLLRLYENISAHAEKCSAPALIYQESNLVIRSIRDYFTREMDEVLIDDPQVYNEAREFFAQVMPDYLRIVKLHQEQRPIFSKYQIEEQIDTISQNQVNLPSGGSIVIDQTEALVAIDVNSGKMASEKGIEATAYKTNLEAADEVARQLRLRDLGGLIVIDFIDMRDRKHGREVEKRLKNALSGDKARVTVGRISQFGLMEMSRQRIKATLAAAAWHTCPHCQGRGKVKSTEAQAVAIMRKIHAGVAKKQIGRVEAAIPSEVAEYLLNTRREELLDMERRYNTSIYLKGEAELVAEEVKLEFIKREKQAATNGDAAAPVTAAAALAETAADAEENEGRRRGDSSEEPQEEAELSETGSGTTEDEGEAATETPRRSRRRRRRGRRGGARSGSRDNEQAATENDPQPTTETVDGETTGDADEQKSAESESVAETEEKPSRSRRSRSRRKKPATDAGQETAPASGDTSAESTDDNMTAPGDAAPAETAETETAATPPKRRRSRKKATEEQAGGEADQSTKDQSAAAEPPPEPARKRRRPAKAAAGEEKETQPEQTPAPTGEAEGKPKRRRSSRKPAAAEDNKDTAETAAATPETTVEEKPKRRRSPRKKATETETTATGQPPEEAPEAESAKPKRRASRKKATEPAAPEETAATVETKKTRRPAARKKAAEQPAADDSAPAEPTAKPKRKPAARKKATPAPSEPTATDTPTAETEKPKPRRRATKKKTEPDQD